MARRPDAPRDRDPQGPGAVVARQSRGRLPRGRRRAGARGAVGSDPGLAEHLVDPRVRRPARARGHDAATRDRDRVPRHRARPSPTRLQRAASPAGAREAAATQRAAAGTSAGGPAVATAPPCRDSGRVDSLERLAALRDRGAITDDEYQAEKTLVITNGRDEARERDCRTSIGADRPRMCAAGSSVRGRRVPSIARAG